MDTTAERLEVMVVGAGLAGTLAALYLARRGHYVELFERRPDPRQRVDDSGRSINLGLSARGMAALREVDLLERSLAMAEPMRGRVCHGTDGSLSFHPYGTADHEVLYSVRRQQLNALLLDELETRGNVRLNFGAKLIALDTDTGIAWFVDDETGVQLNAKADLVIGADGAFSVVRQHLLHGARADFQQEFMDWGYRELTIPAGHDGGSRTEPQVLHLWPGERGLMVSHPNRDGTHTCTLFLPFTGEDSFEALDTPEQVLAFFDRQWPDVPRLIPDLVHQFLAHPVGNMVTVRTSRWHHHDRVVLVGDACHAVYPFYGQGMNAAFEDCSVLDACLRAFPNDRAAALDAYETSRRPNTDVLADLAKRNFLELRDGMRSPWFVAKKKVDLALSRLLPGMWLPLYGMVAHTTMPYAAALDRARRQDAVLRTAAAAAGALLAGAAACRWSGRSRATRR